jgi:hypothetical protein
MLQELMPPISCGGTAFEMATSLTIATASISHVIDASSLIRSIGEWPSKLEMRDVSSGLPDLSNEYLNNIEAHKLPRTRIETTAQLESTSIYSVWLSCFEKRRSCPPDSGRGWLCGLRPRASQHSKREAKGW